MTISLRYAARSDVGMVRQSNQDSGYAGPHLCLLCDGMGGPAGGDIASAIAVSHLAPLDEDSHQAGELIPMLREAVQAAHAELVGLSAEDPELAGLGTTCIAVMRSGNKLAMVHVGDSRAYLLRDGELAQVTTDHTFVEYLVETGRLTREQARRHPQRSVLLRVLGDAEGDVQLDESIREAVPGDRWLLCSDGLSGPVSAETITEILTTVPDPGDAAQQLVDLALRAGGPDNVTAVVFDVVEDADPVQTASQVVGSAATHRLRRATTSSPEESLEADDAAPASPAAKAAALLTSADEAEPDDDAELDAQEAEALRAARRRRRRRTAVGTLVVALVLGVAGVLGWRWTQSQYYVTVEDDQVVIYQGLAQTLGPVSLSHLVETYDEPTVADLDPEMVTRLEDTVSQPSLAAARRYVRTTVAERTDPSATTTPTATVFPTTSPTPTAGAGTATQGG